MSKSKEELILEKFADKSTCYDVTVTILEPMLGTTPKDPEVYAKFIQTKAAELNQTGEVDGAGVPSGAQAAVATSVEEIDDEVNTVPTVEDIENKGWTGFHTDKDGNPFLYNYVVKGFFKEAASSMNRVGAGTETKGIKAFVKSIDQLVFVQPRRLLLEHPDADLKNLDSLERPLRAKTAQGERVTLARSDITPANTTVKFTIIVLGNVVKEAHIKEWLDYGLCRGFGQWRNADYGSFTYEITEVRGDGGKQKAKAK